MTAKAAVEEPAGAGVADGAFRTEIKDIDKKIAAQTAHIGRLKDELREKQAKRAALIKAQIQLLNDELPESILQGGSR